METVADPRIGTVVLDKKLRVDARLGAGGMGAVYRVHHLATKHDRALKVLHPELAGDRGVVQRLMREAGVAGTLRSPHVVETLDVGHLDDGAPYVLMELLEGEPLADRIEELSKEDLIGFVCQACEGVAHAHAAGIVHRDLKPDNLFVVKGSDGVERIKILDFGISKFQVETLEDGAVTREGTILGTPLYMSPEQSTGQSDLGPSTDIYSLGVILYEGISGQTPHEAANFPALLIRLNTVAPASLSAIVPGIDPELAAIVDDCLAIRALDRPESADALLRALAPFASRRHVAHLETLRGVDLGPRRPVILSMAETMAGGLVDEIRPSSRPPARAEALEREPADEESSPPPSTSSIAPSLPRPSWIPWAIAGALAIALLVGLATITSGGGDPETADPAPVAASEPAPVVAPALPSPDVAEPVPDVAPPPDPERTPAGVTTEAPRAPSPRSRPRPAPAPDDIARDNPYE